jgi:hypothetical protein
MPRICDSDDELDCALAKAVAIGNNLDVVITECNDRNLADKKKAKVPAAPVASYGDQLANLITCLVQEELAKHDF